MRVCKQGNVCKLLISWILKYSFAYYLIQNIFFQIPDESSSDEEQATPILWYIFQEMTVAFKETLLRQSGKARRLPVLLKLTGKC